MGISVLTICMIIVLIAGLIMGIIGTVLYSAHIQNNATVTAGAWVLMILGYVLALIALIIIIIDLTYIQKRSKSFTYNATTDGKPLGYVRNEKVVNYTKQA